MVADHCWREGYSDGSIIKEAVDGFLYGRHLRPSTISRNELALRQLADHAQAVGWDAHISAPGARVRVRPPPQCGAGSAGAKANSATVLADATAAVYALDDDPVPAKPTGSLLGDMLDAVGRALSTTVRRLGPHPWQLATVITAAGILSPHPTLR